MERRSYTVVGVGAVGGYYGARLAAAGHPVRWVARSDAEHLRRHGLVVTSPSGDLHLDGLEVAGPDDPVPEADVVILATKVHDNDALAQRLAPAVAPGSIVIALQNGLDVERPLAEALPERQVLGAMSFICARKVGPGRVEHLDYEKVTVGEFRPDGLASGVTNAVAEVVGDLSAAGVPSEALEDLLVGRWSKLAWNIPFNGLSVVLDATTREMVTDPACRSLAQSMMEEVIAASVAVGHPVAADLAETMLRSTEKMTSYAPSMKLDFDAGRPLELAAIYEVPLQAAALAEAPMPVAEALWRQLAFLDARNR